MLCVMKRFISFILAAAVLMCAVSCGNGKKTDSSDQDGVTVSASAADSTAVADTVVVE